MADDAYSGPAGTAQLIDYSAITVAGPHTSIASWFLDCPGQTPGWSQFILHVVHLRDQDGLEPAHRNFPEATHEVVLAALDPEPSPFPGDPTTWRMLDPLNHVQQVVLPDDAAASELARICALAVARGELWAEPPLSGQREPWQTSLTETAAHLRGEHQEADRG